jgi:hypothetical protein
MIFLNLNLKSHQNPKVKINKKLFLNLKKKWKSKNKILFLNNKIHFFKILPTFLNSTLQQLIAKLKTAAKLLKLKIKIFKQKLINKKFNLHNKHKIKLFKLKDRRKLIHNSKDNIRNNKVKFKLNKIACLVYKI